MKILVVSWYFPPANTMGALRLGKLVKYLLSNDHDVCVVCGRDLPRHQTLAVEVPQDRIFRTPWRHDNGLRETVTQFRCSVGQLMRSLVSRRSDVTDAIAAVSGSAADNAEAPARVSALRALAIDLTSYPDERVAWLPHAYRGVREALKEWRPDIVLASAPPFSVLAVGARVARTLGVPWVAEYRDRWAEDPYRAVSPWRRTLEHRLEDALVADASGIATVSEPWAADYRARWGKPKIVVYNGFDPEDFPLDYEPAADDPDHLNIVYTGILYPGRRDPTPVFQALALMGPAAQGVRVRFYGSDPETVRQLATAQGVEHLVEAHGRVPYDDSIRLQQQADVLLLMQWNNPKEQGNCPGKLFEYIAVRRPVLALGLEDGVPAQILGDRGAGEIINEPSAVARRIETWLAEKHSTGRIAALPATVRDGLSRWDQYAKLEQFLEGI